MKKNLLTLLALGWIFNYTNAQDTYINDNVIVKVNPETLFYNGGTVNITTAKTTDTTEKIINEGNIQIQGGFTNANITGKNFVNKYTNEDSYGQLKINSSKDVTGLAVVERVKPSYSNNNNQYLISFPFKNSVKDVINSLNSSGNIFKGECAINVDCGVANRAKQSLLVWDIKETEYDAVPDGSILEPYKRYLLQLTPGNTVYEAINRMTNKIAFTGVPNNSNHTINNLESRWKKGQDFTDEAYGNWKYKVNNYNLSYASYLDKSTRQDSNKGFGKNLHRFGNPYTSNLDLSNIATGSSWITFNTSAGQNLSPTKVFDSSIRFQIVKHSNGYSINWDPNSGSKSTYPPNTQFNAFLSKNATGKYFWTGAWQALLVKPYETFYIDYYAVNIPNAGSRIVSANFNFTDENKTFDYNFNKRSDLSPKGIPGLFDKSASGNQIATLLKNEDLKAKGLVTDFDFTQLELSLTDKDHNYIQGFPVYLLNASFMKTGDSKEEATVSNPIYFYEENEKGDVLTNVQTTSNEFNSEDYIGKPIRIGFDENLVKSGTNYKLNFNLYEYSILNKVKDLRLGKYYLLDKLKNTVTEINGSTEISFTANDKMNDRFEFYWNEKPAKTLGTNDLNTTTYLYYDKNKNQFVHFEQSNTTADIAIYDLTGRQIFSKNAISTNSDYQLNLNNIPLIYVVKITYKDGKTVTKKTIKK